MRSLNGLIILDSLWNMLKNYNNILEPLIARSYANKGVNFIKLINVSNNREINSYGISYIIVSKLSTIPFSIYYEYNSFSSSFATS